MEGTPLYNENSADNEHERRDQEEAEKEARAARAKKAEAFGILAVEPNGGAEKETLSPLERALAATSEKEPETETEKEPVPETEQEVPAETPPEPVEAPERPPIIERPEETEEEPEPAPPIETKPEPEARPEPVEAAEPEPAPVEAAPELRSEEELTEVPEATAEPKSEAEPEPVEAPVEVAPAKKPETPPEKEEKEVEKKKPGFIRSLFRQGEREKDVPQVEKEPEPRAEEPAEKPAAEATSEIPDREPEPEEPEFQFNQTVTPLEKPPVAEDAPESEEESEPALKNKPEHIGKMLLNTESSPVERQPESEAAASSHEAEKKLNIEASPIEPASGKRVDVLSRDELLELGDDIEINGNSLRHAYESHLIGEGGLRRLVAEHLQGGDLPKALRREITEHEMDFERDPKLRDKTHASPELIENNTPVLDKLLEKADVTVGDGGQQPIVRPLPQARNGAGSTKRYQHRYRQLDIALVSVISFLTILIIIVLLVRG